MEKYDIFVGNLPFNITEEQLQKHFSIFGNVKKVRRKLVQNSSSKLMVDAFDFLLGPKYSMFLDRCVC